MLEGVDNLDFAVLKRSQSRRNPMFNSSPSPSISAIATAGKGAASLLNS